ncbi:hypothetical protein AKO1_006049 [Acrasis kona]|uniref:Sulfhydryl oxidase n=1 Tax=Acrasis kona TaxID=1008807 RepID=A0AAW2YGW3_9EUKA
MQDVFRSSRVRVTIGLSVIVLLLFIFVLYTQKLSEGNKTYITEYKNADALLEQPKSKSNSKCGLEPPGLGTLTKEEVGRMTWSFMHTMLANLRSTNSSSSKVSEAIQIVKSTTNLFPCVVCSEDFSNILTELPYEKFVLSEVGSNYKKNPSNVLSRWLCVLHNKVNTKLGKTLFSCEDDDLEKRWKMGSKKC